MLIDLKSLKHKIRSVTLQLDKRNTNANGIIQHTRTFLKGVNLLLQRESNHGSRDDQSDRQRYPGFHQIGSNLKCPFCPSAQRHET
jgi:hypothetical protein